jgi:hypothetical protein
LRLVGENVSQRAAARACGISSAAASRLVAEAGPSVPFTGQPQPSAPNIPAPNWSGDQPRPPPRRREFDRAYHGRSFQSFSSPLNFASWDIERIRNAVLLHRLGNFLESSTLALVIQSFGPVMAALEQRKAPALGLPRHIRRSDRGLSRILGQRIEDQICPRQGLSPSPFFPDGIWGTMLRDKVNMGFSVLQHAYSDPDPETGIRDCYTRIWPTWAVQYYRYRRTYVAITTSGPVDIINDGKFTLVADDDEPHFFGAIVAAGEESFDGKCTQRARASYIDKYGNPKWIATMPPGVAPNTPEGDAMDEAVDRVRGPDGYIVVPNGADLGLQGLESGRSTVMKDALDSVWQYVAAIYLGSDGTMTRGTGVYSAPIFAGVRLDLITSDVVAICRAVNSGHIEPSLNFNYASAIREARGWIQPALEIPLPNPDRDARIKSYSDRVVSFHAAIKAEKENGFEVTQDRTNQLAAQYEIEPPTLASQATGRLEMSITDVPKFVRRDEARLSRDLPPVGGDEGNMWLADVGVAGTKSVDTEDSAGATTASPEGATEPQEGSAESSSKLSEPTSTGGETPGQQDDTTGGPKE